MDEDRFWARVDKSGGPNACWPWTGPVNQAGRGLLTLPAPARRTVAASRYALELSLGLRLDRWTLACHTCDNPPCCNPAHLYAGTPHDNNMDSVRRGRIPTAAACRNGHPWTKETTVIRNLAGRPPERMCRTCANATRRARYQRTGR